MKVFKCHDDGTATVEEIPDQLPGETRLEWMNRMGFRSARIQWVQTPFEVNIEKISFDGKLKKFEPSQSMVLQAGEECIIELPSEHQLFNLNIFADYLDSPPPG